MFVEQAPVNYELLAKILDMSDRSNEAGDAEFEEDKQNFERVPVRWPLALADFAIIVIAFLA